MKIIENPKTKLESVDLIDDNGVLLRITPDSLLEMDYDKARLKNLTRDFYVGWGVVIPSYASDLSFTVDFLGKTLHFHFTGEKADEIAESLYKLKFI